MLLFDSFIRASFWCETLPKAKNDESSNWSIVVIGISANQLADVCRSAGDRLGDHPQIVGDHAPADPAFHPVVAMIPTAFQAIAAFEHADAPLNARPPACSNDAMAWNAVGIMATTGWNAGSAGA